MSLFRFASRSLRTEVTLLVAALLVVACGDSTGPSSDHLGTYTLRSVDGAVPPAVMYEDALFKFEITAASLTLNAAGACGAIMSFRLTDKETSAVTSDTESGVCSYSISGSTLTVTADGETSTATISGGTITVSVDGDVLVYRR